MGANIGKDWRQQNSSSTVLYSPPVILSNVFHHEASRRHLLMATTMPSKEVSRCAEESRCKSNWQRGVKVQEGSRGLKVQEGAQGVKVQEGTRIVKVQTLYYKVTKQVPWQCGLQVIFVKILIKFCENIAGIFCLQLFFSLTSACCEIISVEVSQPFFFDIFFGILQIFSFKRLPCLWGCCPGGRRWISGTKRQLHLETRSRRQTWSWLYRWVGSPSSKTASFEAMSWHRCTMIGFTSILLACF